MSDTNGWVHAGQRFTHHQLVNRIAPQPPADNEGCRDVASEEVSAYRAQDQLISQPSRLHGRQDVILPVPYQLQPGNQEWRASVAHPRCTGSECNYSYVKGLSDRQRATEQPETKIPGPIVGRTQAFEQRILPIRGNPIECQPPDTASGSHLATAPAYSRASNIVSDQTGRTHETNLASRMSSLTPHREDVRSGHRRRDSHQSHQSHQGVEELDPDYRIRDKSRKFFVLGKVFLCVWTEPAGSSASSASSSITTSRFGELVHAKIRRFVVVRTGLNSCLAIPISTYGGHGVAKKGPEKSQHAIIYTGKTEMSAKADELTARGESAMLPEAIRVDPDILGTSLDPMSRVNFGKVYTIEHNIRVKSFGRVNRASLHSLTAQFSLVLNLAAHSDVSRPSTRSIAPRADRPAAHDKAMDTKRREAARILSASGWTQEDIQTILGIGQMSLRGPPAQTEEHTTAQELTSESAAVEDCHDEGSTSLNSAR